MGLSRINIEVLIYDEKKLFTIDTNTTGSMLMDQIGLKIGVSEVWYFGLQYIDLKGRINWLRLERNVVDHRILVRKMLIPLQLKIRYFPQNFCEEIFQRQTFTLFYHDIKSKILDESLYCPMDKAIRLAAYDIQNIYGNFYPEIHKLGGYLSICQILPVTMAKLSFEELKEKVYLQHAEHRGMSQNRCRVEYLKIAQTLENFGITKFQVFHKHSQVTLGVHNLGINISSPDNKETSQFNIPWSDIVKISLNGKKFIVDHIFMKVVVKCQGWKESDEIYDLVTGNYTMYQRRR